MGAMQAPAPVAEVGTDSADDARVREALAVALRMMNTGDEAATVALACYGLLCGLPRVVALILETPTAAIVDELAASYPEWRQHLPYLFEVIQELKLALSQDADETLEDATPSLPFKGKQ